jgi:CheY-specific phosphatase CheX
MSDNGANEQTPKDPPTVFEHLAMMLDQIAAVSWQKLGLQPDIITGKTERKLAEAKIAIDMTAHIAEVIEPQLDEGDRRTVQNLVTSLRLNYVQKSREGTD